MTEPTRKLKVRVEFEQVIEWDPEESTETDATRAAKDLVYWSREDPGFPDMGMFNWPPETFEVEGEWVPEEDLEVDDGVS